jgi:hypothetical protein
MTYPMDATRALPISATIHDCLVQAWVVNGSWTIDVGGHEFSGPALDNAKHNSQSAVKDMLKLWAKDHADLFA